MTQRRIKTGLALGSGGARGLAHIGVLQELEQQGIVPDMVAGTSMGAIIGAAYCAGISLDTLISEVRSLKIIKLTRIFRPAIFDSGLLDFAGVEKYLKKLLGNLSFSDLKIPFQCVATDIGNGERVVFESGRILPAVMASMAVPTLFPPVELNCRYLVDGGLVDPMPVKCLKDMGADLMVGVDVLPNLRETPFFPKNTGESEPGIIRVLLNTIDIMQAAVVEKNLTPLGPDFYVHVKTGDIEFFEFQHGAELIRRGRDAVRCLADGIRQRAAGFQLKD